MLTSLHTSGRNKMVAKRCLAKTARDKQCAKYVFKDGLCEIHYTKNERDQGIELVESTSEVVAKAKIKLDSTSDDRIAARARRKKSLEQRNADGMLANQKLAAPKRDGYKRRWVNDDPGRINEMLDKGYTFVKDNVEGDKAILSTGQGTRKTQVVSRQSDGSALDGYLMEQEDSLYSEDQQTKEEARSRKEEQIRRVKGSDGIGGSAYDPTKGKGAYHVET